MHPKVPWLGLALVLALSLANLAGGREISWISGNLNTTFDGLQIDITPLFPNGSTYQGLTLQWIWVEWIEYNYTTNIMIQNPIILDPKYVTISSLQNVTLPNNAFKSYYDIYYNDTSSNLVYTMELAIYSSDTLISFTNLANSPDISYTVSAKSLKSSVKVTSFPFRNPNSPGWIYLNTEMLIGSYVIPFVSKNSSTYLETLSLVTPQYTLSSEVETFTILDSTNVANVECDYEFEPWFNCSLPFCVNITLGFSMPPFTNLLEYDPNFSILLGQFSAPGTPVKSGLPLAALIVPVVAVPVVVIFIVAYFHYRGKEKTKNKRKMSAAISVNIVADKAAVDTKSMPFPKEEKSNSSEEKTSTTDSKKDMGIPVQPGVNTIPLTTIPSDVQPGWVDGASPEIVQPFERPSGRDSTWFSGTKPEWTIPPEQSNNEAS